MDKIINKDGYVYYVEHYDRKGFETYHNIGKDLNHPIWKDEKQEIDSKLKTKRVRNKKKDEK